ncbi:hypothetical protein BWI97_24210 [Siphonobacter sp. BAB-5405]|uniref:DUF1877 family protein n=1 Tax=Siphonobacter sp. BAB-5405 TaxID=1864825 RepID=UPI000C7FA40C|nr:DUF1877 family protein [Siphonobacter sp. BAB-5405]PMD90214.1 hypothetical protein BWI97_24210 [Siphonobacter sp. BAB-5405]
MGQSLSLYTLDTSNFEQLHASKGQDKAAMAEAKFSLLLQKTFMGLEYVLLKGRSEDEKEILQWLFTPDQFITPYDFKNVDPESLSDEETADYWDAVERMIPYLSPDQIKTIHQVLQTIPVDHIRQNFNAQELNEENIYPWAWADSDDPNVAYTARELSENLEGLKATFQQADEQQAYILCYIG